MKELILNKKTGFSSSQPFEIFDEIGILFYTSNFVNKIAKGETLKFNLPYVKFYYNGILTKLGEPVYYDYKKLPKKQRNINKKRYKIIYGNNPNKCTIFYGKGIILFDYSFKKIPLYMKYDIYYHELGHHYYKTEKHADLYAYNMMIKKGFNKSQIGLTTLETLSQNSYGRKKHIINKILEK